MDYNTVKDLEWNGQITRLFDENDDEYDLPCANAAMEKGIQITTIKWSKKGRGYGYKINN